MWKVLSAVFVFLFIITFFVQDLTGAIVNVPPGKNMLPDSLAAGGADDIFIVENGGLYEIARPIALRGNQQIKLAMPSINFQDQAIVQSFGGTVKHVCVRAERHFYDFPGEHSDPGGRWYWLPFLSGSSSDPNSSDYVGPHVRGNGTIILAGLSSTALEGETELNAWSDGANPADFEKIECSLDDGLIAYGNNYVEGLEMRGFQYPFWANGSHLELKHCKWIGALTGVRIERGDLIVDTCWGTGGSQRVHGWRVIKAGVLDGIGKRKILSGQDNGLVADVLLINSAFYDMFDGILGEYPKKLEIKNCLFDCPRCDDAIQIRINYGSVYSYRTIFIGTGPSWNQDGTNSNKFLTEECIINPGREMYVLGTMRDRRVLSRHNNPEDPHNFIRCTFFNHNPVNSAGNEFDEVLGASGRGADIGPHQWRDCLIYRVGREGRTCAKLGKFYEQGLTDIKGTVIVDANSKNDPNDSFYDGGSFNSWKSKNDPDALYIEAFDLTEADIMAKPNIGAILADRDVGAVPLNAITAYGDVGPDWLLLVQMGVRNITTNSAELYWDAFDEAIVYDVRYRIKGSNLWIDSTVINYAPIELTKFQLHLSGLLHNTTYEWQVRSSGSTNYVPGPNFTTLIDSSLQFVSIALVDSIAAEEYQDSAVVKLTRNSTAGDLTVFLEFSGTAAVEDFDALVDSVIFSEGDSVVQVVFTPFDDEDIEGWQVLEVAIAKHQTYNHFPSQNVKLMVLDNDRFELNKMFIEAEGEVVMEAEHFHVNDMRLDPTTRVWQERTDEPGYVGSGYISTISGDGLAEWENACEVGYNIKFSRTGVYHVWLRRYSFINEPNTVWIGMDGVQSPNQGNDNMPVYNPFEKWMWVNVDSIQVSTIDEIHTFNVRRRENNYRLDRIVLRKASDVPSGNGPAESVQTDITTPVENQERMDKHAIPVRFALHQNHPNPFNPSTTISFALPQKANVTVEIYDLMGKNVITLFDGLKAAGYHSIVWNAVGISSGIYFYRLNIRGVEGNDYSAMGKCILMK